MNKTSIGLIVAASALALAGCGKKEEAPATNNVADSAANEAAMAPAANAAEAAANSANAMAAAPADNAANSAAPDPNANPIKP